MISNKKDFRVFVIQERAKEIMNMLYDMGYSFKLEHGKHFNAFDNEDLYYYIDCKNKRITKVYLDRVHLCLNSEEKEHETLYYYQVKHLWTNYIHKQIIDKKQEEINQLHMEIQGLKGLIFHENKDVEKISLKLFGHKLKLYRVK